MILAEFYDSECLENILSLEREVYERVVFLTPPDGGPDERERGVMEAYVLRRFDCPVEFVPVAEMRMEAVCAALEQSCGESFVADVTGGPELFIAACGYYAAQHPDRCAAVQQFDPKTGARVFRFPDDGRAGVRTAAELNVLEAVSLHRCAITRDGTHGLGSGEIERETLRLWRAVGAHMREWNTFHMLPAANGLRKQSAQVKRVSNAAERAACAAVAEYLAAEDILRDGQFTELDGQVCFGYTLNVPQSALFLYEKAGNLLEHYCGAAAHRSGLFGDCRVSVSLDWDGELGRSEADTKNEVDLILTRGHVPVFVSCKNTEIRNEYLYEIAAMAAHYGGRHAKPVIISNASTNPAVRDRAKDMGVLVIDALHELTFEQFIALLRRRFQTETA